LSLPHFFAGAPEPGEAVVLDVEDARHASRSLRLRPGDVFTSSDGRGAEVQCRVVRAERDRVEGEVLERSVERPRTPRLTVVLAPPKGDRLAWAVQKLTEVGVDAIRLAETARSVRRWSEDRSGRASRRLEAVAREAAKQSRRRFLPEVGGPDPWEDLLRDAAARGPVVLLWEGAETPLLELLPASEPAELTVAVGPEGGISEEEARAVEAGGAGLGSLGPQILRTETAAVVGAALALSRYGRLG
jgi:16S rRNA (uracil1498-N3)-methyltransferase